MSSPEPKTAQLHPDAEAKPLTTAEVAMLLDLRSRVHRRVIQQLESSAVRPVQREDHEFLVGIVEEMINAVLKERSAVPLTARLRTRLLADVLNEVIGFGPLQPLLEDDSVDEIIVNHPREIVVERSGCFEGVRDAAFDDAAHITRIVQRILAPLGRRVDESSPMVDARLPDGSRLNAVLPPVALDSPLVTIRKQSRRPLGMEDLLAKQSLSEAMVEFLRACVLARMNLVISGGPGSGKTTLLRALVGFIPPDERIITIEDSAELGLRRKNLAAMESRPTTAEGRAAITIGDLVRNSLRMHPHRVIVGEVRGSETLDMLQAMNTGATGSLTTVHSNSPADTIHRLQTLCLMSEIDLPATAIGRQIASALHIIVHESRFPDGSRKVTHITEVVSDKSDQPALQHIFVWVGGVSDELEGAHRPTGVLPLCLTRLALAGQSVAHLFANIQRV